MTPSATSCPRARITDTVVGAAVIGVRNNGLNLLAIDAYYQLVAKGPIIVAAVLLDQCLTQRI